MTFLVRFLIISVLLPSLVSSAWAKEEAPVVATPQELASLQENAIKIVPHRAIYKMSLAKVKNGSAVADASGTMFFDWADACDGWAIQQHMKLHFAYAEGDETNIDSTVVTWESKDGKKYNYNVRRLSNGQEDEVFRGRAVMDERNGTAKYAVPKDKKDIELSADTLFPSGHTQLILDKAISGGRLFTTPVFDGSDAAGYAYVSTFIGAPLKSTDQKDVEKEIATNPLLNVPAWPVRLAFYKPEDQSGEPDYEMDLILQANGIARAMTIDYGDFSVRGVLASVELATDYSCPTAK